MNTNLAGGIVTPGVTNQWGEIMINADETGGSRNDIGWLAPVTRLSKELGVKILWEDKSNVILSRPSGNCVDLGTDFSIHAVGRFVNGHC